MIDFASCLTEYAVRVSETSCSAYSSSSCISPNLTPSIQNAVTCTYRIVLSTQKQILVTLTWCKNSLFQGLNVFFGKDPSSSIKLNTNSRLFRKLKGSKSIEFDGCRMELFWDLSTARYLTGPEPVDGYYVFITVDSELGLILGDFAEEAAGKKMKTSNNKVARFSLITRQENYSGNTLYSTKARFCETGTSHDISIRCGGEDEGFKIPALSVSIDNKMVIHVKRLQWNFRGNQTIFLDGLLVDLLWDVHDWFYNPGSGCGVFMFRTRSGFDNSRLWLEEKMTQKKDQDKVEFSLMIYACKNII
ncbi:hypothetical protein F511_32891 [Dorcoceras hygrometricum]|uniref:DUF868 domain-containing protein n=1 Tax=Dorcoceras hygrometricum TaxID=472368 RepID=A0A2Z7CE54_9LAMI|nr:hypothetical protein F511_32891 [Dorcoceras hygrometricum]